MKDRVVKRTSRVVIAQNQGGNARIRVVKHGDEGGERPGPGW
jgi:hypothetical protein